MELSDALGGLAVVPNPVASPGFVNPKPNQVDFRKLKHMLDGPPSLARAFQVMERRKDCHPRAYGSLSLQAGLVSVSSSNQLLDKPRSSTSRFGALGIFLARFTF